MRKQLGCPNKLHSLEGMVGDAWVWVGPGGLASCSHPREPEGLVLPRILVSEGRSLAHCAWRLMGAWGLV